MTCEMCEVSFNARPASHSERKATGREHGGLQCQSWSRLSARQYTTATRRRFKESDGNLPPASLLEARRIQRRQLRHHPNLSPVDERKIESLFGKLYKVNVQYRTATKLHIPREMTQSISRLSCILTASS